MHATIFDHLNGPTEFDGGGDLQIHLFADPLGDDLSAWVSGGRPLWGWPHGLLQSCSWARSVQTDVIPLSVASKRMRMIQAGSKVVMRPLAHEAVERATRAVLDDLRTLTDAAGSSPPGHVLAGLRRAWGHAYTLLSIPCRPSAYDRFCGRPPQAGVPTSSFADEIVAWAQTVPGEMVEYALVLAQDLDDLRNALERHDPVLPAVLDAVARQPPSLIVVRSRTAARALRAALGMDPDRHVPGEPLVCWYRRLHAIEPVDRALVIGPPPRCIWHVVDSGLAQEVIVLLPATSVARWAAQTLQYLREHRALLGGQGMRERAWRALLGVAVDPPPTSPSPPEPAVQIETTIALHSPEDPFEPLKGLLREDRPLIEEDAFQTVAVRDESGRWSGLVEAIEVQTDRGILLLPTGEDVDVLEDGQLSTCRVERLRPGMQVVVSQDGTRLQLLDALEQRIGQARPDVHAARMVVESFRDQVRQRFSALKDAYGDVALDELCRRVRRAGSTKTEAAIRGWIEPDGPLGPRDPEDLHHLCRALSWDVDRRHLEDVHAALTRLRGFRRALGRALAEAARRAVAIDDSRVDLETGLSVADLREAATVAVVVAIGTKRRVRVTEVGRLLEVSTP